MKGRKSRTRADLLGINKGFRNAQRRDEGDAECIIIIVVQRPQDDARHLKHVKRMNDLVHL